MVILRILEKLDLFSLKMNLTKTGLFLFNLRLKWINYYFGKQSKKAWK